jgi:N-acetylglucosamine kinase-like BadF-type ATPase
MIRTVLISICIICSATSAKTPVYEDSKLLASDGSSNDRFGDSVSISSDGLTAIVGALWDNDNGSFSGSAYIYSLVGGVWEETKLLASDGASDDDFGKSVSISSDGTTAIVGAYHDDDNGTSSGSAYIYRLVKGVWQETKLHASDGANGDRFGYSVSISGDGTTALVGAYGDADNGYNSGSAYVYRLAKGVWEETKLLASDGARDDDFGKSVSISGDGTTALVGAAFDEDNGASSGSMYIYSLVGSAWEETKLIASDGASGDHFGDSVSISGDGTTALVGAWGDNDNGSFSGSAYIYELVDGVWEETKLLANDGTSDDKFGIYVSISSDGSTALVGVNGDDDNGPFSGSAYIYKPSWLSGVWEESKLLASDGASDDDFGKSVSISSDGTTALVGANGDDDNGTFSGSAYIFNIDSQDCPDINGDGYVNVNDLLSIIDHWGTNDETADINFDGIVNITDLLIVISNWGPCE